MPEYFKVDSRKVTLREYWNILPSWKVLVPWIAGRFNVSMPFGSGFPQPPPAREMEIAENEFPAQARAKLQPALDQCLQLGFHSPRFFTFETIRRDTTSSFIALLHRSGECTLRLMYTVSTNITPPVENQLVVLMSELDDGTLFFTSDQKPKFRSRPGILTNRLIGAPPARLFEAHQQQLATLQLRNPPRMVHTAEALDDAWDRNEQATLAFYVERGLYVRMPPEEVESEQKVQQAVQTMSAGGEEHADVLAELYQLQNRKGGWGNAILIFFVSMILFLGAGSQQWSWKYALMLVPILFIHELGHYIAMRAFDYRNLRMFFLPFFGAAVAGRHYNVPGWKKVIVSMMGPAPGILLGAVIGGIGLVMHQSSLIQIALVMLILNGINLLPVLPLDGGWIFHTLLFSRHPLLDAAFRVVAVVALAVGGTYSRDKILMYLSIPMLFGIPTAYRIARITAELRKQGVPPGSPDDQTIPTETARAIIGELKKTLPKGHTTKTVAQQTLQIFENLNAKPPGWLATGGLLFAYVTSLGMAAVFAGLFVVGPRGDFAKVLDRQSDKLKRDLFCGTTLTWRGSQAGAVADAPFITIVANFSTRGNALKSFRDLTNQLPSSVSLTTLGDSLLLTIRAGEDDVRKRWFGELQRQTKEVFVDGSNNPARLSLSCRLADQKLAEKAERELEEYLSNDSTRTLIPPWLPEDRRTEQQRMAHQLARRTYLKAQAGKWGAFADPRMRAMQKRIAEAKRQGDDTEATALSNRMLELSSELEKERLENLKAGKEGPMDAAVIDLVKAMPTFSTRTNRELTRTITQEIARHMGQLPLVDGRVPPYDGRFSTHGGSVIRTGRTLHLSWMSFRCISDGAPALISWLCAKGCTDLKYDLPSSTDLDPSEEE